MGPGRDPRAAARRLNRPAPASKAQANCENMIRACGLSPETSCAVLK